jgi:Tetratricopeptide repeat
MSDGRVGSSGLSLNWVSGPVGWGFGVSGRRLSVPHTNAGTGLARRRLDTTARQRRQTGCSTACPPGAGEPSVAAVSEIGRAMNIASLRRPAVLAVLLLLGATSPAAADQRDPRLGPLFDQLKTTDDTSAVEAQIWEIWSVSGDAPTDALMQSGTSALAASDFDHALEAFDQVVKRAPEFAEGWNKRATTLYAMGRYGESVADIATVLRLEPRHFGALSGLGLCNAQQDKLQAAVDAFERALTVNPNMPGVRLNIRNLKQLIAKQTI